MLGISFIPQHSAADLQVAKFTAHTGSDSDGWRQAAGACRLLVWERNSRAHPPRHQPAVGRKSFKRSAAKSLRIRDLRRAVSAKLVVQKIIRRATNWPQLVSTGVGASSEVVRDIRRPPRRAAKLAPVLSGWRRPALKSQAAPRE